MSRDFESTVELLRHRAAAQPDDTAYVFLPDRGGAPMRLSYAELLARAEALASRLRATGEPGDRAVLIFPPGFEFMIGLFGCLIAGLIAVPMMVPRRQSPRDAGGGILADCRPRFALTTTEMLAARPDLAERFAGTGIELLATDSAVAEPDRVVLRPRRGDIAVLQYTSGSTSAPKGVIVSHGNLLANVEMITAASGNTRDSTIVSWVPLYHDMGLVGNAFQALFLGAPCVLMSPVTFLQRPHLWLKAIQDYRAQVAGGPNFAFDLCVNRVRPEQIVGLDLSGWKWAFISSEPVRAESLERFVDAFRPYGFDPQSLWACYGMAETTLLVAARHREGLKIRSVSRAGVQRNRARPPHDDDDLYRLVSSGRQLNGEQIAIVEPDTRSRLAAFHIGEVWVAGPHVGQGYWGKPGGGAEIFAAQIAGEGDTKWLRTGDLAFLDEAGELYITGRIKDVIIVRGVNHYPQDIEATVQESHSALRRHGGAAFGIDDPPHGERLVIVQEVERTERHRIEPDEIAATIREAVTREHEVAPYAIVLIRPGTLPKTTSGKIQRALTRELWREGGLSRL